MSATTHDLFTRATLDASGMQEGVKQAKAALTSLNKSFTENKEAMKENSAEIKRLETEQKNLASLGVLTKEQSDRYAQLSAQIGNLKLKSYQLKTEEQDLKTKISSTNKELSSYYNSTSKGAAGTDTMKKSVTGLAGALKAVAFGYTGKKLYEYLIGSNAEMEQYTTSFSVMLGGVEKAQSMIKNMAMFAAKTPLEMTDIVSNGQTLMNYGVAADDVIAKLTDLGNLASGNAEKLGRVTLAYGQMLAKGKVSGEELRQMTEAGVPLLQALSNTMGETTAQVQSDISKSKVSITDLNNAITSLTTGDGKFAGMMEQQSQTMNGLLSTLKDNIAQFGRDVGEGAFQEVKQTLQDIMDKLQKAQEDGTVQQIAQDVGASLSTVIKTLAWLMETGYNCRDMIIATIATIAIYKSALGISKTIETVTTATKGLAVAQGSLNAAIMANPFALMVAAIAGTVGGIWAMNKSLAEANEESNQYIENVKKIQQETESESDSVKKSVEQKIAVYENLRTKTVKTAEDSENLKIAAADLQKTIGDGIPIVDSSTGKYNDLSKSLDSCTQAAERYAKMNALKDSYDDAKNNIGAAKRQIVELEKNFSLQENSWIYNTFARGTTEAVAKYVKGSKLGELVDLRDKVDGYEYVIDQYNELMKSAQDASGSVDDLTGSLEAQTAATSELADSLSGLQTSAKLYQSVQDELNESGKLSLSTLEKIVKQYPQMDDAVENYINGISTEKDLLNSLSSCYQTDYNNYYSLIRSKLEANGDWYKNVLAQNADAVNQLKNQYGIDLENYSSYTAAKSAVDKAYAVLKKDTTSSFTAVAFGGAGNSKIYGNMAKYEASTARSAASKLFDSIFSSAFSTSTSKYSGLVNDYSASTSSGSSSSTSSSKELSIYEIANQAYEKLVNERIDLINKETEAKKDAMNQSIDAINAEIEARKRLSEDKSVQDEIDAINAQLKYAKMDDFSRMELEKQLEELKKKQSDTSYEREMEARKASLQDQYKAQEASAQAMIDEFKKRMSYAGSLFSDLKSGSQSATSIVNNNSRSANVSIVNNALTAGQIAQKIIDELMDGGI